MIGSGWDHPDVLDRLGVYLRGGLANFTGQPIRLPDGETYSIVEWDDDEGGGGVRFAAERQHIASGGDWSLQRESRWVDVYDDEAQKWEMLQRVSLRLYVRASNSGNRWKKTDLVVAMPPGSESKVLGDFGAWLATEDNNEGGE